MGWNSWLRSLQSVTGCNQGGIYKKLSRCVTCTILICAGGAEYARDDRKDPNAKMKFISNICYNKKLTKNKYGKESIWTTLLLVFQFIESQFGLPPAGLINASNQKRDLVVRRVVGIDELQYRQI